MDISLPPLYTRASTGKIQIWKVSVKDNQIITEYGQLGSNKMQVATKECFGKNKGKSNETSDHEQAILEAKSLHAKRVKLEYQLTPEAAEKHFTWLPMTAQSFDDRKDRISFPVCVQPKLDGCRALAMWKDGKVILISRGNELWECPWITNELEKILPKKTVLDGEVYCHGMDIEDIQSLVSDPRPESEQKIKYHVYDIPVVNGNHDLTWEERSKELYSSPLSTKIVQAETIELVSSLDADSIGSVYDFLKVYENQGYEGAMARTRSGKYKFNDRSSDLLKVKTFKDKEFKIVDFRSGKGKFAKSVIWKCETETGQTFEVVCEGTIESKEDALKNAKSCVGRWLKVKYFKKTQAGIPRFPVGISIRLDKDMG